MFIGSLGDSFQFRQDFNLFCISSFDQDTGEMVAEPAPRLVQSGQTIPDKYNPVPQLPGFEHETTTKEMTQ